MPSEALRNALLPVVTIVGLQMGTLLSGAVLTETIFGLAGAGTMLFEAISARDFPIIQGFTVIIAAAAACFALYSGDMVALLGAFGILGLVGEGLPDIGLHERREWALVVGGVLLVANVIAVGSMGYWVMREEGVGGSA